MTFFSRYDNTTWHFLVMDLLINLPHFQLAARYEMTHFQDILMDQMTFPSKRLQDNKKSMQFSGQQSQWCGRHGEVLDPNIWQQQFVFTNGVMVPVSVWHFLCNQICCWIPTTWVTLSINQFVVTIEQILLLGWYFTLDATKMTVYSRLEAWDAPNTPGWCVTVSHVSIIIAVQTLYCCHSRWWVRRNWNNFSKCVSLC